MRCTRDEPPASLDEGKLPTARLLSPLSTAPRAPPTPGADPPPPPPLLLRPPIPRDAALLYSISTPPLPLPLPAPNELCCCCGGDGWLDAPGWLLLPLRRLLAVLTLMLLLLATWESSTVKASSLASAGSACGVAQGTPQHQHHRQRICLSVLSACSACEAQKGGYRAASPYLGRQRSWLLLGSYCTAARRRRRRGRWRRRGRGGSHVPPVRCEGGRRVRQGGALQQGLGVCKLLVGRGQLRPQLRLLGRQLRAPRLRTAAQQTDPKEDKRT